ncbi:MAG: hypothetical protein CR982_03025 [Candidatus Cloacimonadota bacterium]|nr:MAG: hypothetical protein CR982_03025 [Candidatus Cloacimonadota bacterium]PIE82037.1 MAG: hypothetical protein CSA15_00215 [Candidatus Delongbacteria bacterium]
MKISSIVRILITGVIFYLLFRFTGIDLNNLFNDLLKIDIQSLIYGFIFLNISIFVSGFRWRYLLNSLGFPLSQIFCIKEYYKAHFYNNFLPTSVGGDISRIYNAGKKAGSVEDVLTTVFLERGLGIISLVAISCIGMLFLDLSIKLKIVTYLMLPSTIALLLLPVIPKTNAILVKVVSVLPKSMESRLLKILDIFLSFHNRPLTLFIALSYSLFFRVVESVFVFFIVNGLGIDFSFQYVLVLHSIVSVIKFIPITINGLGVSETAWVTLTINSGIGKEKAALISLLIFSISFINSIIGGGISVIEKYRR